MQSDMHYYGTYVMARAAGLNSSVAEIIATAAEYVDDSNSVAIELNDGILLEASATAHHPINLENLDVVDQRKIWVPFHFIPGNEGDTFEERLICRKDGALAKEMVDHHLNADTPEFHLELMGITAHAYADTFSHYGFSGISSELNQVNPDSIQLKARDKSIIEYITRKAVQFGEKYVAGKVAATVGLGHGSVSTYPDRPYLTWSFQYQTTGGFSGERVNQETFLEACQKLHAMFSGFAENNPDYRDDASYCRFPDIQDAIKRALSVEGDMNARIQAWQEAASSGGIYPNPGNEPIPNYTKNFETDIDILRSHTHKSVGGTNGYAFLAAAKFHRDYMLDKLLPKHDLHVLVRT